MAIKGARTTAKNVRNREQMWALFDSAGSFIGRLAGDNIWKYLKLLGNYTQLARWANRDGNGQQASTLVVPVDDKYFDRHTSVPTPVY